MRIRLETLRLLAQMGDSAASIILAMLADNPNCVAWATKRNPIGLEIRFSK